MIGPAGVAPTSTRATGWRNPDPGSARMSLSQADLSTDRPPFSHWIRSSNNVTQQFLAIGGQPDFVSLAGGLPAAELYPVEAIKQASTRALERWGSAALEYGPVEGFPTLRATIAERMSREHKHR